MRTPPPTRSKRNSDGAASCSLRGSRRLYEPNLMRRTAADPEPERRPPATNRSIDQTEDVMSKAIIVGRAVAAIAVGAALSVTAAQANAKVTFRDVLKPDGHARTKAEQRADGQACGTSGPGRTLTTTLPV